MKTFLVMIITAIAVSFLISGCDNNSTPNPTGSAGLFRAVGVVKFVNMSQQSDIYVEVETEQSRILAISKDTEVYLQTADFTGFNNSSVAPDIRNGIILQPNQTVEYYYTEANVNYGAPKTVYLLSKIYIYLLGAPSVPDVTED